MVMRSRRRPRTRVGMMLVRRVKRNKERFRRSSFLLHYGSGIGPFLDITPAGCTSMPFVVS